MSLPSDLDLLPRTGKLWGPKPQPRTLVWTLFPLGTRRRSRRCPFACSPPAGSGQSSLLQGGTEVVPGASNPSPFYPQPWPSRPHHFQSRQAPQEDSHCPRSTQRQECFHSARREGASVWRAPLQVPNSAGLTPEVGQRLLPCLGPHTL